MPIDSEHSNKSQSLGLSCWRSGKHNSNKWLSQLCGVFGLTYMIFVNFCEFCIFCWPFWTPLWIFEKQHSSLFSKVDQQYPGTKSQLSYFQFVTCFILWHFSAIIRICNFDHFGGHFGCHIGWLSMDAIYLRWLHQSVLST